ncbi:MAG: protein kinase [Pseudomonadota bacterium]
MLRPGERIGDWIVETRLGERDRGAVFLARHGMNLNLRGALKVAQPSDYEEARASFVAEVEPLLTLQHEALIRLLGWGEDYERRMLWMTTELLRGQSLEERLSEGRPFGPEEVGFVFGRLAGVLALIHSHGSHHGDLRPSDVLIAEGRQIRLTGFGTVFRDGKQGRVDPESLAYVGPEYFDDPDSCSPVAADIYSLGLILYEALTGRRVFPLEPGLKPAPQVARLMGLKLRMGPLDPGDDVPLPLRRIVLETTDPDPAARPGELSSFLAALGLASRLRTDDAPAAPTPPRSAGNAMDSVRLLSSVLGREQLQTPFPFAPPGWGPRGHQPPPPLANLRQGPGSAEVPEAGRVLEVHKVDQRRAADDPLGVGSVPVGEPYDELYDEPYDEPYGEPYGEPEVLPAVEEEPASPAPVEAPPALSLEEEPEALPAPDDESAAQERAGAASPEPHEAPRIMDLGLVHEDEPSEEAVLVEPPGAPVPERATVSPEPDEQPEPVDFVAERRRSARAFVPPPPVPDPSEVGLAGRPTIVPEATALPASPPEEAYDAPDPPMVPPAAADAMPLPVAPSATPGDDDDISWFDRYDDLPESPEAEAPRLSGAVATIAVAPAPQEDMGFEEAGDDGFATELPEAPGIPRLPEAVPRPRPEAVPDQGDAVAPTWPGEPEEELPEEDDWSWHDDASFHGEKGASGLEPREPREPREDPYTRPVDDEFDEVFDPSASDIAADVFGDHPERAAWVKRGLLAVFALAVVLGLAWVLLHGTTEPSGSAAHRVEVPPAPVVRPEALPSMPPPPSTVEAPELEAPPIDLRAVVAEPAARPASERAHPTAVSPAPSIQPSPIRATHAPASASSPAPSTPASGTSEAFNPWVTTPTVEVGTPAPSAAPVQPAPAPVAPASGLMAHLREGWSSLDSGNLLGAQNAFMAALKDDAGNGMAHYGLGQVAERARDYSGAEYHYGRAYQALGGNPSMRGELEAALRRIGAKVGQPAAPAPAPAQGAAAAPAATPEVQVTRKKRDELEESFHDELWDDNPDE